MTAKQNITIIGEQQSGIVERISSVTSENSELFLISLGKASEDIYKTWVVDYTAELLMYLKAAFEQCNIAEGAAKSIVLTVWGSDDNVNPYVRAAESACWEAVRAIVHVLTIEKRAIKIRLNAIYGTPRFEHSMIECIEFLSSEKSGFFAGSTFDVRSWI